MERVKSAIKLPDLSDDRAMLAAGIIYILGFTGMSAVRVGTMACEKPYVVSWHTPVIMFLILSGASCWAAGATLIRSLPMTDDKGQQAQDLWKRWLKENEGPWVPWGDSGIFRKCYFCRKMNPVHKESCVYLAAKQLVAEESESTDA